MKSKSFITKVIVINMVILAITSTVSGDLPDPGMEIVRGKTALVITDPQNDFLSPKGAAWGVVGKSVGENNTIENIARLFNATKQGGIPVFISPHYYYPTDNDWKFGGALEELMHNIGMYERKGQLNLEGFEGSGSDWLDRYKKYIEDGKTVVTSPHKVYGPESNDLVLQLRKRRIDKIILAGMSANLCTESHMRELIEQGFEVTVVSDATAAAQVPEGDGFAAASINFRFIASAVWTTDQAIEKIKKACKITNFKDLSVSLKKVDNKNNDNKNNESGSSENGGLPDPGMEIIRSKTALVITDPQNDFLSPKGVTWGVVGKSVVENNTIENIDRLFKATKQAGIPVFISPHYYYPTDNDWQFGGALEALMHNLHMYDRKGALNLEGFEGSGSDWLDRYKKYIEDGKTVVTSPHKIYGPETNDLVLQLRKRRIDKIILGGMSANLCTESHMRELIEQGFEVAVVSDATAAAQVPEGDGYAAALINFRFIASTVWTTDQAIEKIEKAF
jgi:nicotinamidase-related amidase